MSPTAVHLSGPITSLLTTVLIILSSTVLAQTTTDPTLTVSNWGSGLNQPTTMAFLGPNDALVLEKPTGQVRRILSGVVQPGNVLDVHVHSSSERGLLGIAINTESPQQVFLYYTEAMGADNGTVIANRVYRYTWNAGLGVLQSPQLILDLPVTPGPNHDGGVLVLGPTGEGTVGDGSLLYVVIGDLNRNGQLENNAGGAAPDDTAVILRVEQDGTPAPGNPFIPYCSVTTAQACPGGGGCPGGETCRTQVAQYYAYGVRNSFGMGLDPVTGDLWDTENGPSNYDEINVVAPGFNSGWNQIMGPDALDPQGIGNLFHMPGAGVTYSDPEFSWFDTNAPTAIVFPNGTTLGLAYDDVALVADANNGNLYRFPLNGTRSGFDFTAFPDLQDLLADNSTEQNQVRLGQGFGAITDLKIGPDSSLYVVSIFGNVFRIAGGGPTPTPTRTPTTTPTLPPPACAPTPEVCRTPAVGNKATVVLRDNATDTKDSLVWRWIKGAATMKSEFGDPVNTHDYELCIYAGGTLVANTTIPAGGSWDDRTSGYRYSDRTGMAEGIQTIVLRAGTDEKAYITVRGKGAGLDMPNVNMLASPLTMQLKREGGTVCWGATYSFPPALKHTDTLFRDRAD